MARHSKKRSAKAGLPPGTLVHIGEKKTAASHVMLVEYDENGARESQVATAELADKIKLARGTIWVNLNGLGDIGIMEQIGACFNLHPLVLEDIFNTEQRSKLEDYGDYLYVVLKTFVYEKDGPEERLSSDQISLVIGKNFVLSFLETNGFQFEAVRERLRSGKGQILKLGADFLMYSLIDAIVDSYFVILERLDEKTEALETELISNPLPRTLHAIYRLKRENVFLRRSLWPLREVINSLQRGDSPLMTSNTLLYLRDVYDHTIHIIESVESLRDLTSGMLDIYISSISYRISAVMKVLTVITTIFMPLTLIAGIYGMNFKHLPGLDWDWGFFTVLGIMAAISVGMLALFRRKKWL
ncbi:magnesium/cobalt transporter CorA [Nitrosovibrio tenuis]|uniref:Magnesium transport protein CorA n=1 Tax=Nitrosovibrio tenuis TaxID=1233 RepID=A0A1H7PHF6_9PROT|nr:magnesium/cobalt transporter CorA [Nitrosovibrio tenuis]SEL35066.1 magnesium transporter [Nitrosovibrio tenuis]